MVTLIGDPQGNNDKNIALLRGSIFMGNPQHKDLRQAMLAELTHEHVVLDCGKSTREYFPLIANRVKTLETLDINNFGEYPTYQMDLCETIEKNPLANRYDAVACFSVLEHCYNPFQAAENILKFLKPGGKIYGYVPFLFPHHGPDDNSYQDYFRFTNSGVAMLFRMASRIEITSDRGRVATSIMVLTTRYKYWVEKRFPRVTPILNKFVSEKDNFMQSSGYYFVITK